MSPKKNTALLLGTLLALGGCDPAAPQRVGKVTDVVNQGDEVKVKVLGFDDRGKVRLSMKIVDQATGKEIAQDANDKGE